MKIAVDTHTHTIVSGHAYSTMKEMIIAAQEKGLEGLAITEHAPELPGSCGMYHFHNYRVVPREYDGLKLLLGVEANIMNVHGEIDMPTDALEIQDIVIASMHTPCFEGVIEKEVITEAYVNVMKNPYVQIIGHPDDDRFPVDYDVLVQAAKDTHTLLEINNTSLSSTSFRKGAKENYKELLRKCKEHQVMMVMGSDAHIDLDVGNNTRSSALIEEYDFPEELIANTSYEKLKSFLLKR
jgi:Histidinol phosphatase and related hydrolases of the PHP family